MTIPRRIAYVCPHCEVVGPTAESMAVHINSHQEPSKGLWERFLAWLERCPKCPHSFMAHDRGGCTVPHCVCMRRR